MSENYTCLQSLQLPVEWVLHLLLSNWQLPDGHTRLVISEDFTMLQSPQKMHGLVACSYPVEQ